MNTDVGTLPVAPATAPEHPVRRARPARRPAGPGRWLVLLCLTIVAVLVLAPFVIIAFNAIKTPVEYAAHGSLSFPHGFNVDGIRNFWNRVDYGQKLENSLLISGAVAVFAVILSVLNAYALGIGRVRGRTWVLVLFMVANTLPQESLVYPLYYIAKQVHLYNTQLSVIIVFTVIQSAFGTYLLSSVFSTFPKEILEAARIDGASRLQVLWRGGVRLLAPVRRVRQRGDTLNGVVLTVEVFSPMPDVIGVRSTHHSGGGRRGPSFELLGEAHDALVAEHGDRIEVTSGGLTASIGK